MINIFNTTMLSFLDAVYFWSAWRLNWIDKMNRFWKKYFCLLWFIRLIVVYEDKIPSFLRFTDFDKNIEMLIFPYFLLISKLVIEFMFTEIAVTHLGNVWACTMKPKDFMTTDFQVEEFLVKLWMSRSSFKRDK